MSHKINSKTMNYALLTTNEVFRKEQDVAAASPANPAGVQQKGDSVE